MQRNPEELYELGPAAPDVKDAPMLHYLEGFIDAGNAGRLLAEHLLRNLPTRPWPGSTRTGSSTTGPGGR